MLKNKVKNMCIFEACYHCELEDHVSRPQHTALRYFRTLGIRMSELSQVSFVLKYTCFVYKHIFAFFASRWVNVAGVSMVFDDTHQPQENSAQLS